MIKFENVSKSYGKVKALNNVNTQISGGKVVGILGPNGSGKTTFLKLIQGYLKPSKGKITVFDHEVGRETKAKVSYLPDKPFIPTDYKIREARDLYQKFFDDFNLKKFDDLINLMQLDVESKVSDLSKGMSEKFHLALILSRDADIFVIDEPIAGVDLLARDMIMNAIFSNISEDKLLIITTHLIDEMESLFDEVIFISKGEIILQSNAEELRMERSKSIAEIYKDMYGYLS